MKTKKKKTVSDNTLKSPLPASLSASDNNSHPHTSRPNEENKAFEVLRDSTFRQRPISLEFIERLAEASVESALTKKNDLKVMAFFHKHGFDSNSIKRWCARSDKFKDLYQMRLRIISDKREIGGLLRHSDEEYLALDGSMVAKNQRIYDPEWAQVEQERARERLAVDGDKNMIVVVDSLVSE
jgi:hypothetical protein